MWFLLFGGVNRDPPLLRDKAEGVQHALAHEMAI